MIGPASRYAQVPTASVTDESGRTVAYLTRRFLPDGAALPLLAEVQVGPGERLDLFTSRTLGDPEQFWRVCDANDAMNPSALEEEGKTLRVPLPQP
jgi:hypothetical protein